MNLAEGNDILNNISIGLRSSNEFVTIWTGMCNGSIKKCEGYQGLKDKD